MTEETAVEYAHTVAELAAAMTIYHRSENRQLALDLFDAFGSKEKTLHANLGGHTGVPQFELDAVTRFFARHPS